MTAHLALAAAFGCAEDESFLDDSTRPGDHVSEQQQSQQAPTCLTTFESLVFGFTRSDIENEGGTFSADFWYQHDDIPEEGLQSIGVRVREGLIVARNADGSIDVDWDANPQDAQSNIYHRVDVYDSADPNRGDEALDGSGFLSITFGQTPDSRNSRGPYNVRTHDGESTVYKVIFETCGLYETVEVEPAFGWCEYPDSMIHGRLPNCVTYDERA